MASQYIIDINFNDDLPVVIRKCNDNFRAIMSQNSKQSQIDKSDAADVIADEIAAAVGEATDSLVRQIDQEATARRNADNDLDREIDTLSQNISTRVAQAVLATYPINSAYMTFGTENPSNIIGGTWTSVGTLTVGSSSATVWKRTA